MGAHPETEETSEGIKSQEMLLNMGPQHPSTHGVLRLVLALAQDGHQLRAARHVRNGDQLGGYWFFWGSPARYCSSTVGAFSILIAAGGHIEH